MTSFLFPSTPPLPLLLLLLPVSLLRRRPRPIRRPSSLSGSSSVVLEAPVPHGLPNVSISANSPPESLVVVCQVSSSNSFKLGGQTVRATLMPESSGKSTESCSRRWRLGGWSLGRCLGSGTGTGTSWSSSTSTNSTSIFTRSW
jgi:hypothetical protein